MKKIVQMKNKLTKISNKIVKKHVNSSNQMWFTSTPEWFYPAPLSVTSHGPAGPQG